MPRLTRWFIRASLAYLGIGFLEGALLQFNKGTGWLPFAWNLLPSHMEFLQFGWIIQLCMGMAFWILPRFRSTTPRGNENLAWIAFGLVNAGILLAASAGVFHPVYQFAGRLLEIAGVLFFVAAIWGRVKPLVIPKIIKEKLV